MPWMMNEEADGIEMMKKLKAWVFGYMIKKQRKSRKARTWRQSLWSYEDVRQVMASKYPTENFGPWKISKIPEGLDDHEKSKLERFIVEEKRLIKVGYGWVERALQDSETKLPKGGYQKSPLPREPEIVWSWYWVPAPPLQRLEMLFHPLQQRTQVMSLVMKVKRRWPQQLMLRLKKTDKTQSNR